MTTNTTFNEEPILTTWITFSEYVELTQEEREWFVNDEELND